MKNKATCIDQRSEIRIPDWLFHEAQEDDFLMGKLPKDLGDAWEEEEEFTSLSL